jgi:hypothetical protein
MPLPKWTRANPGKGKHGVPDKGAHAAGKAARKQAEADAKKEENK